MNIVFVIDNSLTMCQKTHYNLTLLEIAKISCDHILKRRGESRESGDQYFLFATSSPRTPLSSAYIHEERHLLHQLKNIQHALLTDTAETLRTVYSVLGAFRVVNGTDSLSGGLDVTRLESAAIFLFTDCSDARQLNAVLQVRSEYALRCDQQLQIVRLAVPGVWEKSMAHSEKFKRDLLTTHPLNIHFHTIGSVLNGHYCALASFEEILAHLDNLNHAYRERTNFSLLLNILPQPTAGTVPGAQYLQPSGSYFPYTEQVLQFGFDKNQLLLRCYQLKRQDSGNFALRTSKKFLQPAQQQNNFTLLQGNIGRVPGSSSVPLPWSPAEIVDTDKHLYKLEPFPTLFIDFSHKLDENFKLPKDFPHERIESDMWFWEVLVPGTVPQPVSDSVQFVLYAQAGTNKTAAGSQYPVGIFKQKSRYAKNHCVLYFYLWNFLELWDILEQARRTVPAQQHQQSEALHAAVRRMSAYLRSLPTYYLSSVRALCHERAQSYLFIEATQTASSLTASAQQTNQQLLILERNVIQLQTQQKHECQSTAAVQKNLHVMFPPARLLAQNSAVPSWQQKYKNADCCALYSQHYEQHQAEQRSIFEKGKSIFMQKLLAREAQSLHAERQALATEFAAMQVPSNSSDSTSLHTEDTALPHSAVDEALRYAQPAHSRQQEILKNMLQLPIRDPYSEDDEIKYIKEPENVLGNPFKLVERKKPIRVIVDEEFTEDSELVRQAKQDSRAVRRERKKIKRHLMRNKAPSPHAARSISPASKFLYSDHQTLPTTSSAIQNSQATVQNSFAATNNNNTSRSNSSAIDIESQSSAFTDEVPYSMQNLLQPTRTKGNSASDFEEEGKEEVESTEDSRTEGTSTAVHDANQMRQPFQQPRPFLLSQYQYRVAAFENLNTQQASTEQQSGAAQLATQELTDVYFSDVGLATMNGQEGYKPHEMFFLRHRETLMQYFQLYQKAENKLEAQRLSERLMQDCENDLQIRHALTSKLRELRQFGSK